jgi:hypothetical protein
MIRTDIAKKATRNKKYSCGFNFIERGRALSPR